MNLVIVESPAKGKTIEKYLGSNYKVLASFGHVRDLPKKSLGVDVKNNFEPIYEIPDKALKVIKLLKNESKNAETIYLATDYDREGEAIAYHLVEAIKPKNKISRITFHEITKPAIVEAIKKPREIDLNLVNAQQARRILDRLVGYKLSPFLWKKVAQGLSAGRVQSVAVRLIVEKEEEIKKFVQKEFWTIEAELIKKGQNKSFIAELEENNGIKIDKKNIENEKQADEILNNLKNAKYIVLDKKEEAKKKYPSPPFTTSTMQMEAGNKLGYSAKQTMRLAQNLYEDGFITYMRTDSFNISSIALNQAKKVITEKYGKEYALSSPRFYKTKSKNAQEAHEAIRPTDLNLDGNKISLSTQHIKLYNLILKRTLATQMKEAEVKETNIKIEAKYKENKYGFRAKGLKIVFPGFMKVYNVDEESENILPEINLNDELLCKKLDKKQHFTQPPPRYGEGSLIKELEKLGIGRPSTYAPIISTIQDRGYVEKVENRFVPKDIGVAVNKILVEHFPNIVDYGFTAKMEEELDEIAEGKLDWKKVCEEFYTPFSKNIQEKTTTVEKSALEEETDLKCPKCNKNIVIKMGRFGKFYACKGFPECKYTKPYLKSGENEKEKQETKEKCQKCGSNMVMKESKYGPFLACEAYPKCKFIKSIEIVAEAKCPNCNGKILKKRTKKGRDFWGCGNYPKCKTAFWQEPINKKCPNCDSIMIKDKNGKIKCSKCK